MTVQRTLEKTVSFLLELIDTAMIDGKGKDSLGMCEEIKSWFEENKNWFSKLNHFDDKLTGEIANLAQVIDNARYGDLKQDAEHGQDRAGTQEVKPKRGIKEVFKSVKDLISKISVDECEMPPSTIEEAQSEGPRFSEDWLNLGIEESILESPAMATLELSYTVLDLHLKMCLLCFAIFPEKVIIKKRSLIYWWIGEGFVRKTKTKTAEEAGGEAFRRLIDMGLINPEYKMAKENEKENPVIDSCTMHPWIRRMVITVAKKAEFFDLDRRGAPTVESFKSHRICFGKDIQVDQSITPPLNTYESEDKTTSSSTWFDRDQKSQLPFITLFNIDKKRIEIQQEWFSRLKRVSVIQLGRWQHKADHHVEVENEGFLEQLGALTHLKYLSLRGMSRITKLPSSVLNLVLLQILDLMACHNLETLPPDISPLRKLTHLDVSECYLLESMPKGLDKLFSLQVLKGFVVETSRRSSGKLVNLSQLKNLRKLSVYIGSQDITQEEELYSLKDIENLRVLTITWKEVAKVVKIKSSSQSQEEDKVLDKSFSFPPKLEKLDLRCIPFNKQPDWLKPSLLSSLKTLYIRGGKLRDLALEADQKWKVKILRLKYLYDFQSDKQKLSEGFPYLKYYEKIKCGENVVDEVWRTDHYEEDEMSEDNEAYETKSVARVQGEEKKPGAPKEGPVQESSEVVKQDDNQEPDKDEDKKASSSKVLTNEPNLASKNVGEEAIKADTMVKESKGLETEGGDNQEPNKDEDKKASSSKVLTNEPNLASTIVGEEAIKADTMVKESKGLEKQGDNGQMLNKVEDIRGSINNLTSNGPHLVAPAVNKYGKTADSKEELT